MKHGPKGSALKSSIEHFMIFNKVFIFKKKKKKSFAYLLELEEQMCEILVTKYNTYKLPHFSILT